MRVCAVLSHNFDSAESGGAGCGAGVEGLARSPARLFFSLRNYAVSSPRDPSCACAVVRVRFGTFRYGDGDFSLNKGYLWITIVDNISITGTCAHTTRHAHNTTRTRTRHDTHTTRHDTHSRYVL